MSRNVCKMPKQDSDGGSDLYQALFLPSSIHLFLPLLSFLRLPIPVRAAARMVIMGYRRVGTSLCARERQTQSRMGKVPLRFTVVKRNSERIKIPSRLESFRLQNRRLCRPRRVRPFGLACALEIAEVS